VKKEQMKDFRLFTHPREYIPNNIGFRVSSSFAFSSFKLEQAVLLKRIKENTLLQELGQEILLFNFDIWFDFLVKLEQYFLVNHHLKKMDSEYIGDLLDQMDQYCIKTLLSNTKEQKEREYIQLWHQAHSVLFQVAHNYITSHLLALEDFKHIVNLISRITREIFYEAEELDHLFNNGEIILNITPLAEDVYKRFQVLTILHRSHLYKNYTQSNEIILQNYASPQFLKECKDILQKEGFKVELKGEQKI